MQKVISKRLSPYVRSKRVSKKGTDLTIVVTGSIAMKKSIKDFGRDLRKGGVGIFYYAGHGLQVNGRNYLVPIGADFNTVFEIEYEAVAAGRILGQMEDAGNGMNIIILDACRNIPYSRGFRSSEKGLAKMDATVGSILAYSTAPGSVAADGTGRNGLYTSQLLKHISTPGLKIEDIFKQVRIGVSKESRKKQIPWESSSLMGDFYFNPKRGITVTERPLIDTQSQIEEMQQNKKSKKKTADDLESKELRYARSLLNMGEKSKARKS